MCHQKEEKTFLPALRPHPPYPLKPLAKAVATHNWGAYSIPPLRVCLGNKLLYCALATASAPWQQPTLLCLGNSLLCLGNKQSPSTCTEARCAAPGGRRAAGAGHREVRGKSRAPAPTHTHARTPKIANYPALREDKRESAPEVLSSSDSEMSARSFRGSKRCFCNPREF